MLSRPARADLVHMIPLHDLIHAIYEHYPKMGKPSRIVASLTQVVAWGDGLPGPMNHIMGVPVEVGPDADCEIQWVKKVLPK